MTVASGQEVLGDGSAFHTCMPGLTALLAKGLSVDIVQHCCANVAIANECNWTSVCYVCSVQNQLVVHLQKLKQCGSCMPVNCFPTTVTAERVAKAAMAQLGDVRDGLGSSSRCSIRMHAMLRQPALWSVCSAQQKPQHC